MGVRVQGAWKGGRFKLGAGRLDGRMGAWQWFSLEWALVSGTAWRGVRLIRFCLCVRDLQAQQPFRS